MFINNCNSFIVYKIGFITFRNFEVSYSEGFFEAYANALALNTNAERFLVKVFCAPKGRYKKLSPKCCAKYSKQTIYHSLIR